MNRPFFNDSIARLEAIFEERKTDKEFLKLLADELSFRSTKIAKNLRLRVMELIQSTTTGFPSKKSEDNTIPAGKLPVYTLADDEKYIIKHDISKPLTNHPLEILSSWIALEVLSPQTFDKPQNLAGAKGSVVQLNKLLLPWEGNGEKSIPNHRLYYQIVLETIDFKKAVLALLDVVGDKRIERPAPKGEAILGSVVVDNKGRPVKDSAVMISSFGWGVPKVLNGDLNELSEWSVVEDTLRMELNKILCRTDEEGNVLPLNAMTLTDATNYLIRMLKIPEEFIKGNCFAIRSYLYFTNSEPPDPLLLNSFYIDDLIMARNLFKEGKATNNLQQYVGMKVSNDRKNILYDNEAFENALAPSIMPPARWPGPGRHPLVVLQQAAVNLALKSDGILSVNGPPGTGKTTLLRDILAGIITNRAEVMCTFDNPAEAFIHSGQKISVGQSWLHIYEVDKSLKGFEILIASSNNKAVENVSAELPGLKAIAEDANDLRYFTCVSNKLLDRPSWGLVAAVLGNATNRSIFRQNFWWDEEVGLAKYLAEAAGTPQFITSEKNGSIEKRRPRIVVEENAPQSQQEALERWRAARKNFQLALTKSRSALAKLEKIRQLILTIPKLEKIKIEAGRSLKQAYSDETMAQLAKEAADVRARESAQAINQADQTVIIHKKQHPHFFARLFKTASARIWKQEYQQHIENLKEAKKIHHDNLHTLSFCATTLNKAITSLLAGQEALKKASEAFLKAEKEVGEADLLTNSHIINNHFFKRSHEERHITSPWCKSDSQYLRDNVFIAAIQLHKAFIDAAAKPLKHNLGVLMSVFAGRRLPDEKKQAFLPDLWSSLFLIVQCVSTTFASVDRMLGKMPTESLGWLLIDEAGQALPQAAVGALMRTKHAVIVGDPIQIEPVVTLPETLTQNICRQFGIDPDRFNAPKASVQTLADTATSYYTEFEDKYGSRSVGVPLLVHRRCEEPMFGISNEIAYQQLMVQAKKPNTSPIKKVLGESQWFDVQGQGQEKWCPEEGAMVVDMLLRLRNSNIAPNLYIITPFVIVADNIRKVFRDKEVLHGWIDGDENKWIYEHIGTVHTVQGREAEAVILVLGAPLSHQMGARNWAGSTPNLLNVAVTRAKEVLYVIGNRQLWQGAGVFKALSKRL